MADAFGNNLFKMSGAIIATDLPSFSSNPEKYRPSFISSPLTDAKFKSTAWTRTFGLVSFS